MTSSWDNSAELQKIGGKNASVQKLNSDYQMALGAVDDMILKNYVTNLSNMDVVPLNCETLKRNIRDNVDFFKITEMVYEKEEEAVHKFASVFNTLAMTESAIYIIINSDGIKTDFYMGIRAADEERTTSSLKNLVEKTLKGQFPGVKTEDYDTLEDVEAVLDRIKTNSIASVTCVANNKIQQEQTNANFVQGLEKLVLSMQGEKYTGIIMANGTTQEQLRELRKGYETVYSQLSSFASTQVNYSRNSAQSYTTSSTSGTSHSEGRSENQTDSDSTSTGTSHSVSQENAAAKAIKGVASAASIIGAALAPLTGGVSLAVGGVVSGTLGMVGSVTSKNISNGTSENKSTSHSHGTGTNQSDSRSQSTTEANGLTNGSGEGVTVTVHNKTVEDMLERINKQLKRMDEFESLGMFECAAYFTSDDQYSAEMAASTYKALMRGENSGVEVAAVNLWGQHQPQTKLVGQYVTNFIHPVFWYDGPAGRLQVTPCSLVSGNELAIHMGLPRRSVCGLPVVEHADFGKEVVSYSGNETSASIQLGKIFNMGSVCKNTVRLNRNSLAMHTFVTGSTGSGKSNTVYEILRQLDTGGVNFMVVEPAKGEYKNVFGNRSDVHVFGTNPKVTELLRINPFRFPDGIHVLEHIDRLIEIFNVCWPMYAAMPAVLKDAMLQAYEVCGWDLNSSTNHLGTGLYPTFKDLLAELVDVIDRSAYDQEVKSNYRGSLETRVHSLTNGLNGQIFSNAEIDNEVLFDQNTIIDLSRVGSTESKALIMGILIMRLNEYRMTSSTSMNVPLHHVTVLEEAHNILRRTSTGQSEEGSNVAGKSVEMIANSIAEMRTYGEGFIIADQSPSAVDISAIRNTNTKIIMRLPEEMDRRLAGKAAALRDDQLDEIAKLPKGVAVVYQNDWVEPVLCKIGKFNGEEKTYRMSTWNQTMQNENSFHEELLKLLLKGRVSEQIDVNVDLIRRRLPQEDVSTKERIEILHWISEYEKTGKLEIWEDNNFKQLSGVISGLVDKKERVEHAVRETQEADGLHAEALSKELVEIARNYAPDMSGQICLTVCQCMMKTFSVENSTDLALYDMWYTHVEKGGKVQ